MTIKKLKEKYMVLYSENQTTEMGNYYLLAEREWFSEKSLSECFGDYGQKISNEEAGDVPIYSEEQQKELDEIEKLLELEDDELYDLDIARSYLFDRRREIQGNPIKWELYESVLAYNYHDGHNWATIILDDEFKELDEEEDGELIESILLAWDNREFDKEKNGYKYYTSDLFEISISFWQGSWEVATISEKK